MAKTKTETEKDSNIAGRTRMITKDLRWDKGLLLFHQNGCEICHQFPPKNSPEKLLHLRGYSAECSRKMGLMS